MKNIFFGFIAWLFLTLLVLVLFITQAKPFYTLLPTQMIILVEAFKLFFISVLMPLFIKPLDEKLLTFYKTLYGNIIVFIILFLPLTLMAQYFSLADAWAIIRFNILLLLIGGIAGLCAYRDFLRWYYFIWALITAVFPILRYFILEFADKDASFLLSINPFWLVGQFAWEKIFIPNWLLQLLMMFIILIIINLIPWSKKEEPAK
jgi:hypothetical protein